MAKPVWDKVKLWNRALRELSETVDFGTLNLVQKNAYLDSLEGGVALIGCKSFTLMETFQRKQLYRKLEPILSELCQSEVIVQYAQGRPRIIEKPLPEMLNTLKPMDDNELAALHAQYGDIMGIVDGHPVFVKAHTPIQNAGWGIFKKLLTKHCTDYGVMTVLTGLREVASKPQVKKPRAYFLRELQRGRWGHKLVITPSVVGPQLQSI